MQNEPTFVVLAKPTKSTASKKHALSNPCSELYLKVAQLSERIIELERQCQTYKDFAVQALAQLKETEAKLSHYEDIDEQIKFYMKQNKLVSRQIKYFQEKCETTQKTDSDEISLQIKELTIKCDDQSKVIAKQAESIQALSVSKSALEEINLLLQKDVWEASKKALSLEKQLQQAISSSYSERVRRIKTGSNHSTLKELTSNQLNGKGYRCNHPSQLNRN